MRYDWFGDHIKALIHLVPRILSQVVREWHVGIQVADTDTMGPSCGCSAKAMWRLYLVIPPFAVVVRVFALLSGVGEFAGDFLVDTLLHGYAVVRGEISVDSVGSLCRGWIHLYISAT
jgi:hypothetical protein